MLMIDSFSLRHFQAFIILAISLHFHYAIRHCIEPFSDIIEIIFLLISLTLFRLHLFHY